MYLPSWILGKHHPMKPHVIEDMKFGLLLKELPESWSTFVTMNSQVNSLSNLITKILHEKLWRQLKESTSSLIMIATFSRTQKSSHNNRYRAK